MVAGLKVRGLGFRSYGVGMPVVHRQKIPVVLQGGFTHLDRVRGWLYSTQWLRFVGFRRDAPARF